jgi:tight adherence protein C
MLPVLVGSGAIGLSVLILVLSLGGSRRSPGAARNLAAGIVPVTDLREAVLARSATERALQPAVSWLAARARRLTPIGRLDRLERRLLQAGVSRRWTLERVLAAKVALAAAGVSGAALLALRAPGVRSFLGLGAGALIGYLLPDLVLIDRAQRRREAIQRALPDTLDQLAITVEAGLAFESAVARMAKSSVNPLADELARMLQDVQAGMTRREAMQGMADRVDAPELRTFVTAVLQADRYGVAISQVLRAQSAEQRLKRSQRAEEKAAKLPVKLLFPTVFLIFPVLFIVLLGPAVLQMSRSF